MSRVISDNLASFVMTSLPPIRDFGLSQFIHVANTNKTKRLLARSSHYQAKLEQSIENPDNHRCLIDMKLCLKSYPQHTETEFNDSQVPVFPSSIQESCFEESKDPPLARPWHVAPVNPKETIVEAFGVLRKTRQRLDTIFPVWKPRFFIHTKDLSVSMCDAAENVPDVMPVVCINGRWFLVVASILDVDHDSLFLQMVFHGTKNTSRPWVYHINQTPKTSAKVRVITWQCPQPLGHNLKPRIQGIAIVVHSAQSSDGGRVPDIHIENIHATTMIPPISTHPKFGKYEWSLPHNKATIESASYRKTTVSKHDVEGTLFQSGAYPTVNWN